MYTLIARSGGGLRQTSRISQTALAYSAAVLLFAARASKQPTLNGRPLLPPPVRGRIVADHEKREARKAGDGNHDVNLLPNHTGYFTATNGPTACGL